MKAGEIRQSADSSGDLSGRDGPASGAPLRHGPSERGAAQSMVRESIRPFRGEREPLDVAALVIGVGEHLSETSSDDFRVEVDVARDLWSVPGDATQLRQVLLGFCANARDAMPAGGKVSLRGSNFDPGKARPGSFPVAVRGSHVLLEVADTGSGIDPEIIQRITGLDSPKRRSRTESGVGLSKAIEIVSGHGGVIHIQSAPLRGTVFQVYLPAVLSSAVCGGEVFHHG